MTLFSLIAVLVLVFGPYFPSTNRYLRKEHVTHLTIGSTEDLVANKMVKQLFHPLDDCEKDQKLYDIFGGESDYQ